MTTVVTQKEHFMTSPRVIYFGISTQKSASEVGGWSKVEQMGLKDALTYDTTTRKYHNYTKSEITNLINHLQTADLIVGFNQLQFEYKILSSYINTNFNALPNFDMLSKIEGTLNFRVSRDNLSQNTLGESKHSKGRSSLGKRIDTTKKLFAHGCKEGYLSYRNNRFGTKEVCDTSNWADTARSVTERKQLLDQIVVPNEPELPRSTPASRIPSESPKEKPRSGPITTPSTKLPPKSPKSSHIAKQAPASSGLSWKEYLRAKYLTSGYLMATKGLNGSSIGTRIPEEALRIYDMAKNQHYHSPALHTYNEMMEANLLDPTTPFHQFNVAIVGQWLDQNRHKNNYKNGNSRFYHIDGGGTLAPEWVRDYRDMRNIKEELARG